MLVGQGAKGATDEVIEVAELLGAGIAKALNGRAAVPDDLPFVTGSIGLLGTKPSDDMMEGCDTLLMVGTSFPYSEWLPEPGQARGVQIDIDARKLGIRYPVEVAMVGDAAETLRALIPHLQRKEDRSWREEIEAGVERWWRLLDERAQVDADPINPQPSSTSSPSACPTAPSCSPTPARPQLVRPPPAPAPRHGHALSGTRRRCARRCPTRSRPSSPSRSAPSSPAWATARCRCSASTASSTSPATATAGAVRSSWSCSTTATSTRSPGSSAYWPATRRWRRRRTCRPSTSPPTRASSARGHRVETPGEVGPRGTRAAPPGGPSCPTSSPTRGPAAATAHRMEHAQGFARALLHGDPDSGHVVRQSLREKLKDLVTR